MFVARDVAMALGYVIPHKAVTDHCKGVLKRNILTAGGNQIAMVIPERDVYRLVMHSKLPSAEAFEEWVVDK
jgi:prophage antirepressor-like protein